MLSSCRRGRLLALLPDLHEAAVILHSSAKPFNCYVLTTFWKWQDILYLVIIWKICPWEVHFSLWWWWLVRVKWLCDSVGRRGKLNLVTSKGVHFNHLPRKKTIWRTYDGEDILNPSLGYLLLNWPRKPHKYMRNFWVIGKGHASPRLLY